MSIHLNNGIIQYDVIGNSLPAGEETGIANSESVILKSGEKLHTQSIPMAKWRNHGRWTIYSVYLIMFLDMFAVSLFVPYVKFRMKFIGGSDLAIGLITSAYGVVQLVSTPMMGSYADKYNRKIVLLICLLVTAMSYVLMGIATNLVLFTIARLLTGWFKHTQILGKTMLSELAQKNGIHLTNLLGSSEAFGTMGFTLGPMVGAQFIQKDDGFSVLCLAACIIFLVNIFLALILLPEFEHSESKLNSGSKLDSNCELKFEEEIQYLSKSKTEILPSNYTREIISIVFLNFLFCLAIQIVRESVPFMLKDKYDTTSVQMGYMYSLQNFASTVTGFTIGFLVSRVYKKKSRMVVLHGGILQLVSILLLLNTTSFSFACIGMILQSVANQFLAVGLKYLALLGTTQEGSTLGILQTASSSSRIFAPVLVGYFGSSHDEVILMAASLALLGLLGTMQFVQEFSAPKIKVS